MNTIQKEPCFSELLVARFHEVSDLICCNLPCHQSVVLNGCECYDVRKGNPRLAVP